ncbi:MAG: amino acid ABC transporter substrate-binding protein [Chloroflexi bacterium]|nr:amino acid ABC transporter substrate-binding protein [Chloroflexota bacterium]
MKAKRLTRREFLGVTAATGAGLALAGCKPSVPATEAPAATQAAPTKAAAPTAAPPTKDKIVVGMSRPLTGALVAIGDSAFGPISKAFVEEVNAAGGIEVAEYGKKLPIETIIYDDTSDVGTMTRLTEKLILEDKVDFLWPACGTSFIYAQAPLAEKYGYLLITAEGGASTIREMLPSMPHVFVTLSFSDWYQLPVFAELVAKAGAKTAFVTYIADLHGIEYSGSAGIEFPKNGIDIVGLRSLPPDMTDFSEVIRAAQATNPDVFCLFGYPGQIMPTVGTCMGLGFNPKAWLGGPGVNFGFFHTAFGPAVEGIMGFDGYSPKQSPALKELADKLYTGKPEDIQDWWGHPFYWAGLQIWKQAIEKAGSLDQEAIRNIVATEHFETVLGDTWFDKGLLAKECHMAEIGQWQNGVFEVVGPVEHATAEVVYPKPDWPTG